MDYRDYIKNFKLLLTKGFNNLLNYWNKKFNRLILPEGFNKTLDCSYNNLTKLILPQGFNSYLNCSGNNLNELILPQGFNSKFYCDETVRVYNWNEWLSIERERKLKLILDEL